MQEREMLTSVACVEAEGKFGEEVMACEGQVVKESLYCEEYG
jgi:hypothetical protein